MGAKIDEQQRDSRGTQEADVEIKDVEVQAEGPDHRGDEQREAGRPDVEGQPQVGVTLASQK